MEKITCFDDYGQKYEFEEHEFVDRPGVYGIYKKDDSVLLVRDSITHIWVLPGGGLDKGETEIEGLAREFFEETGLTMSHDVTFVDTALRYFFHKETNTPWKQQQKYYLVKNAEGELAVDGNGEDIEKAAYIKLSELKDIQLGPLATKILTKWAL